MRKTFKVGKQMKPWLRAATVKAKKEGVEVEMVQFDRLNYLICLIEARKNEYGILRKSSLIEVLKEVKGSSFIEEITLCNIYKDIKNRDISIWLLYRICQLPMLSIKKELGTNENTCTKAVIRVDKMIIEKDEVFAEVWDLIDIIYNK